MLPRWLDELILLFLNAFMGFLERKGGDKVRKEVKDETDALNKKFDEIDARPPDPDGAIGRLRNRRASKVPRGQ